MACNFLQAFLIFFVISVQSQYSMTFEESPYSKANDGHIKFNENFRTGKSCYSAQRSRQAHKEMER
jgi:hypothetical protein